MNDLYVWSVVAVVALVTALIRAFPFLIFGRERQIPKIIEKLGAMLPYAIMGMLVVYCLKDVTFVKMSGFLPAFISCLVVGVLYVWKRNTLVSIVAGTISYMFLVQVVF